MRKGIAHVLLVAVLASSGASAPFRHVHAHGSAHHPAHGAPSSHGDESDEHCAHHHTQGAHWHPAVEGAADAEAELAAAGHGHAAVTLSAVAIEVSPVRPDAPAARLAGPEAGTVPVPRSLHAPVDPTTGPDPPPRALDAARAPPVRA